MNGLAPLIITVPETQKLAREWLERVSVKCICGWFDWEYKGESCPICKTPFALLTEWWREMNDRFWGMSRAELKEDFETWCTLSAEIVE